MLFPKVCRGKLFYFESNTRKYCDYLRYLTLYLILAARSSWGTELDILGNLASAMGSYHMSETWFMC